MAIDLAFKARLDKIVADIQSAYDDLVVTTSEFVTLEEALSKTTVVKQEAQDVLGGFQNVLIVWLPILKAFKAQVDKEP